MSLDPSLDIAANNLGFAYGRAGRDDDALRVFRAAVGEARAQLNLAVVHDQRGQPREAAACRARAVEIEPRLARLHGADGPDDKKKKKEGTR
jgi:hypothetical protein